MVLRQIDPADFTIKDSAVLIMNLKDNIVKYESSLDGYEQPDDIENIEEATQNIHTNLIY